MKKRWIYISLLVLIVVCGIGAIIWANSTLSKPTASALSKAIADETAWGDSIDFRSTVERLSVSDMKQIRTVYPLEDMTNDDAILYLSAIEAPSLYMTGIFGCQLSSFNERFPLEYGYFFDDTYMAAVYKVRSSGETFYLHLIFERLGSGNEPEDWFRTGKALFSTDRSDEAWEMSISPSTPVEDLLPVLPELRLYCKMDDTYPAKNTLLDDLPCRADDVTIVTAEGYVKLYTVLNEQGRLIVREVERLPNDASPMKILKRRAGTS